jgi:hypothetical protein
MEYLNFDMAALKHLGDAVRKVFYHLSSTDSIRTPTKSPGAFHEGLRDQWRKMTQILGNDAWELRYWGSAETAPRW